MVKQGYKQTEIGVIPEDWNVVNLEKNFTLKARIGWQGLTTAEYLESGDYCLITGTDFKNGYIDWDNCVYVEKVRFDQDRNIQIKQNDVLITKDGTIGKIAFIDKISNPTTLNSGVFVARPKNNSISNRFFYYVLMSFYFDDFLSKITAGSTITHLYQKDFVHFNFILPPLAEQEAIATALSDADAWIESLEQLIAKKRLIKQGAMQELLTPKEDWEVKKLGEVAYVTGAGVDKKIVEGEKPVVLLNYLDVYRRDYIYGEELWHEVTAPVNKVEQCDIKQGDVLITPSSELANDIGITALAMEDMDNVVYSYHLYRIRFFEELHWKFKLYLFKNRLFLNQAEKFAEGSGKRYVISLSKIREFDIAYPKSLTEQTRIATILADMDAEIEALEQKLSKARQIKQGMMQELLTGKTRLV